MCFMYQSSVVGMLTKRMRFGGRRTIEHDHVITAFAPELVDVHHGAQLFHAGQDGQFFRFDVADAGGAQDGNHVGGDLAPVPLDLLLDVHFMDGQAVGDRDKGRRSCRGRARSPGRRNPPANAPDRRS